MKLDAVVIGGGFFGMYIAEHVARAGGRVLLLEKGKDFMQRASLHNQARVHQGYHYPRSMLTALRSRLSFPRFSEEFADCVVDESESYYLIGKILGKVTASQFEQFCRRIGAPCEPAPHAFTRLTNPALIEASFRCVESSFDAVKLKQRMTERLYDAGVDCRLGATVTRVQSIDAGVRVHWAQTDDDARTETVEATRVFNCAYSMLNAVLQGSGIEPIALKHELAEIALVEPPPQLHGKALTVMCGPFFSVLPFPSAGLHAFTHVRYTPHCAWHDLPGQPLQDAHRYHQRAERRSAFRSMVLDASRYLPLLQECRYVRSLWEVKTVLPRSEADDGRPILFRSDEGIAGLHCILGGKIDNIYDAVEAIDNRGLAS